MLFDLCSGLLCFLYTPLPFLSLWLGSPAAVPGFRFPFLVILYLLSVRQRLAVAVAIDFSCFLTGFFLVSFPLRASRLRSPEVFSVSPSFCFAGLSVIICSSPDVGFASVSSSFSPVRLLRVEFRTPYSLVGCSNFSSTSVGVLSWLLDSPFLSFVFLPCLLFFRSSRFRSPVFFLPICCSVLLDCVSLHEALLFLLPFRLVCSCFGALLPSLQFVCMG